MNFVARQSDKAGARARALALIPQTGYVAPNIATTAVAILEALMLMAGSFLVVNQYPGFGHAIPVGEYALLTVFAAILHLVYQQVFGLYQLPTLLNPLPRLKRLAASWIAVFATLAGIIFMLKVDSHFSRAWLLIWFASGLCFTVAIRIIFAALLQSFNRQGQFNRNAVVIGSGALAEDTVAALKTSRNSPVNLVGFFDDRSDSRSGVEYSGLKKLGDINDFVDFARVARIDLAIVAIPTSAEDRIAQLQEKLSVLPLDVRISAIGQKMRFRPRAYSHIGNLPCLDLMDRPLGDWGPVLKSVEDKIIASIALVALSPVLLAIALAVKFDSRGPILFKQKRYGFNNELIEVYKFRSMYADKSDFTATKQVTKGDPRVTRIGRFIRKASLDELPQLFNVLKGELSLVGPRPHATKAKAAGQLYENVVDGYFARHKVKPGMTGWAQINGWRGETDTKEKIQNRVRHDLHYIENWSLTFDLYILAKTPIALLSTENAY